jgi:hypothetical protein
MVLLAVAILGGRGGQRRFNHPAWLALHWPANWTDMCCSCRRPGVFHIASVAATFVGALWQSRPMEAIGERPAEFGGSAGAPRLVLEDSSGADFVAGADSDVSADAVAGPGSSPSGFSCTTGDGRIVRPRYQNGSMEAIGERPEQFGGNVVVLGRAGVAARPAAEGFSGSGFGDSGSCIPGSPAAPEADDGTRLSPGRLLRAVPAGWCRLSRHQQCSGQQCWGQQTSAPTESQHQQTPHQQNPD